LVITDAEIEWATDILEGCLKDFERGAIPDSAAQTVMGW